MSDLLILFQPMAGDPHRAEEQRDYALAALAFEHEVTVAVLGERVRQLASPGGQAPGPVAEHARPFRALVHHGVRELLVSAGDLEAHGLRLEDLAVPVRVLDPGVLAQRLAEHATVVPL